jgi:thiosulfate dehydrogenase (quinone) large subunit
VVPVGPETNVLTPPPPSPSPLTADVADPRELPTHRRSDNGNVPANDHNLRSADWLYRSRAASVIWLAVRLVLGYWWLNAGYQKIWGSEKAAFWFGGGAGVKGFATAGVLGSATGKSGASYGWWAGFLHNFVIPNASWIAKLISLGELAVGIALILGLFTGLAALGGLTLNMIYMFTGSAGVNPAYMILEVPLILAWRNAGYLGLDRYALNSAWLRSHFSRSTDRSAHRPTAASLPVPNLTS